MKNANRMFSDDFLKALSNWQKGWGEDQDKRRELADTLVKECESLSKKFKKCNKFCYRKRFIVGNEIVPIIIADEFFEGIASWTMELDYAKNFKGLVKPMTKFAVIFKQIPKKTDVVVNIVELWKSKAFRQAVKELDEKSPEIAYPLLNFGDSQKEVILRTTLKGSQIEHIVGISNSFEKICDMANIPEEKREELSIEYSKNPNGIPIELPIYTSKKGTKKAVQKSLQMIKQLIDEAQKNNIPVYNLNYESHIEDLKHNKG